MPDRGGEPVRAPGSTFEAEFECVPVDGGIRVRRRIAFGFATPLCRLLER
ncbi:hypothetical protein AB0F15_39910 [Amycolatopsis sp. NPDC026612]